MEITSFSEWLQNRDSDLSSAIKNEVSFEDIGQSLRHPVDTARRIWKQHLRTPAMNLAMGLPLSVAGGQSMHPELPEKPEGGHEVPISMPYIPPGEEAPGKEEKGGLDELAHYVADRLMKKLYELDYKVNRILSAYGKPFTHWLLEVARSLFRMNFPTLRELGSFLYKMPQNAVELVRAAYEAGHEVMNKFTQEPPSTELTADVVPAVQSKKIGTRRQRSPFDVPMGSPATPRNVIRGQNYYNRVHRPQHRL